MRVLHAAVFSDGQVLQAACSSFMHTASPLPPSRHLAAASWAAGQRAVALDVGWSACQVGLAQGSSAGQQQGATHRAVQSFFMVIPLQVRSNNKQTRHLQPRHRAAPADRPHQCDSRPACPATGLPVRLRFSASSGNNRPRSDNHIGARHGSRPGSTFSPVHAPGRSPAAGPGRARVPATALRTAPTRPLSASGAASMRMAFKVKAALAHGIPQCDEHTERRHGQQHAAKARSVGTNAQQAQQAGHFNGTVRRPASTVGVDGTQQRHSRQRRCGSAPGPR